MYLSKIQYFLLIVIETRNSRNSVNTLRESYLFQFSSVENKTSQDTTNAIRVLDKYFNAQN